MSKDGIIYFNLTDTNNGTQARATEFNQTNISSFVDNASDYNLGIVRFRINTGTIPTMIVETNNTNNTVFNVSMQITGQPLSLDTENLIFVQDVNVSNILEESHYYYSLTQFLDITNTAMAASYNSIVAFDNTFPANFPPFISYNYETKFYELYVEKTCYDRIDPLQIFFNSDLNKMFMIPNILTPNNNLLQYNLTIKNRFNNIKTLNSREYLVMSSERIVSLNNAMQKMLFVSTQGLNTKQEISSNKNNPELNVPIITDFEPDLEQNNSNYLQFQSSGVGNIRLVDFNTNGALQNFNISVYYQDQNLINRPVLIDPKTSNTLKLAFIPTSYFQSAFN